MSENYTIETLLCEPQGIVANFDDDYLWRRGLIGIYAEICTSTTLA